MDVQTDRRMYRQMIVAPSATAITPAAGCCLLEVSKPGYGAVYVYEFAQRMKCLVGAITALFTGAFSTICLSNPRDDHHIDIVHKILYKNSPSLSLESTCYGYVLMKNVKCFSHIYHYKNNPSFPVRNKHDNCS